MKFYTNKDLCRMLNVGENKLNVLKSPESIERLFKRNGRFVGIYEDDLEKFLDLVEEKFEYLKVTR